jgi:hypothetical protein
MCGADDDRDLGQAMFASLGCPNTAEDIAAVSGSDFIMSRDRHLVGSIRFDRCEPPWK